MIFKDSRSTDLVDVSSKLQHRCFIRLPWTGSSCWEVGQLCYVLVHHLLLFLRNMKWDGQSRIKESVLWTLGLISLHANRVKYDLIGKLLCYVTEPSGSCIKLSISSHSVLPSVRPRFRAAISTSMIPWMEYHAVETLTIVALFARPQARGLVTP